MVLKVFIINLSFAPGCESIVKRFSHQISKQNKFYWSVGLLMILNSSRIFFCHETHHLILLLLLKRVYTQNTKKLVLEKHNSHFQLCFLILAFVWKERSNLLTQSPSFDFVHRLQHFKKKLVTFRKLVLLPSLGNRAPNLVDRIDRAIFSHWIP